MHPILFHVGAFAVRSYSVLVMLGFLAALYQVTRVCTRRMKIAPPGSPRRIDPETMFDIGFAGLFAGLLGARLGYVLLDWSDYAAHPLDVFKFWQGGLSIHGGLFAGILFMLWATKKWKKVSFPAAVDLAAVAWPVGQAIGRIGCLLNGCCYGAPCNLPWAVKFPDERYLGSNPPILTQPSHPIQAYETLINLFFFFWLVRWQKRKYRDGELAWAYIAMYGALRFGMEFLRAGVTSTYRFPALHITDTHIVSAIMVAAGLIGISWLRRHRQAYADAALPPNLQVPAPLPAKDDESALVRSEEVGAYRAPAAGAGSN